MLCFFCVIRKGSANTRNGQRVTARNLSDDNERARMTKKDLAYHHFDTLPQGGGDGGEVRAKNADLKHLTIGKGQ